MVRDLFREGISIGVFRDTDPRLATLATFGMCNWAYQWYRSGSELRPREIAYKFWGYLMDGVGRPENLLALESPWPTVRSRKRHHD